MVSFMACTVLAIQASTAAASRLSMIKTLERSEKQSWADSVHYNNHLHLLNLTTCGSSGMDQDAFERAFLIWRRCLSQDIWCHHTFSFLHGMPKVGCQHGWYLIEGIEGEIQDTWSVPSQAMDRVNLTDSLYWLWSDSCLKGEARQKDIVTGKRYLWLLSNCCPSLQSFSMDHA